MTTTPDRIEKKIVLHAPLQRVWQAIADSKQFGVWFGVSFDRPFIAGTRLMGRIVPTRVDPEVAKLQQPYEGKSFQFFVDRIDAMRSISFRWHPYAVDAGIDYAKEPTTLIVFKLTEVTDGTLLTVSESGFDNIPLARRAKAFTANEAGWAHQMRLIEKYLSMPATA
jgi:uncharacterized protein YndB with AHSA1/START domain